MLMLLVSLKCSEVSSLRRMLSSARAHRGLKSVRVARQLEERLRMRSDVRWDRGEEQVMRL